MAAQEDTMSASDLVHVHVRLGRKDVSDRVGFWFLRIVTVRVKVGKGLLLYNSDANASFTGFSFKKLPGGS